MFPLTRRLSAGLLRERECFLGARIESPLGAAVCVPNCLPSACHARCEIRPGHGVAWLMSFRVLLPGYDSGWESGVGLAMQGHLFADTVNAREFLSFPFPSHSFCRPCRQCVCAVCGPAVCLECGLAWSLCGLPPVCLSAFNAAAALPNHPCSHSYRLRLGPLIPLVNSNVQAASTSAATCRSSTRRRTATPSPRCADVASFPLCLVLGLTRCVIVGPGGAVVAWLALNGSSCCTRSPLIACASASRLSPNLCWPSCSSSSDLMDCVGPFCACVQVGFSAVESYMQVNAFYYSTVRALVVVRSSAVGSAFLARVLLLLSCLPAQVPCALMPCR